MIDCSVVGYNKVVRNFFGHDCILMIRTIVMDFCTIRKWLLGGKLMEVSVEGKS